MKDKRLALTSARSLDALLDDGSRRRVFCAAVSKDNRGVNAGVTAGVGPFGLKTECLRECRKREKRVCSRTDADEPKNIEVGKHVQLGLTLASKDIAHKGGASGVVRSVK